MSRLTKQIIRVPPCNPIDPSDYYKRNDMERARGNFDDSPLRRIKLFFEAGRWNKAVGDDLVLDRLDFVKDSVNGNCSSVKLNDKPSIRWLALELGVLGGHYNLGITKLMAKVHEAELAMGGVSSDLPRLSGAPFNVAENLSCMDDNLLLESVICGKKPVSEIGKEHKAKAEAAGLVIVREGSRINVSKPIPTRELFDIEELVRSFSVFHPLLGQAVRGILNKMADKPPARFPHVLLKERIPLHVLWPARHAIAGIFFGYPLENVYEFVNRNIFKPLDGYEPRPFWFGKLEEWQGIEFKRILKD
jgi:hypothetical protein